MVAAFRLTLPPERNEVAIPGLASPVEITLDPHGIPWIRAASAEDAFAALGYVHARDRLFQMELMRRGGAGRLAEVIGPMGLRLDRFSRLLGLEAKAEADLAGLPEDTRAALAAYARGVNAWIAERGIAAAPEFLLLGIRPEPWRETDSLLWGKVMGLLLTGNMRTELARLALSTRLPRERIDELWPRDTSPGSPVASAPIPAIAPDHVARVLAALPVFGEDAPHPSSASNIWAVDGRRTVSGKPLLANDPHLALVAPGPVPSRAGRGTRAHTRRRLRARRAVPPARPQRPHRLGLHHHPLRHAGRLRRTPGGRGALSCAGRAEAVPRARGTDPRPFRRRRDPAGARDAQRAGDLRSRPQPGHASSATSSPCAWRFSSRATPRPPPSTA
ncbi:MAG: penicillin acylase family protein [Acetobacteraceae bacterium]|nr:penicillin acylase family protein [Acetobacteraceae bacterium]